MSSFDYAALQKEQRQWSLHNFGDTPSHQPLLGLIEEAGELEEALVGWVSCPEEVARLFVLDGLGDAIIFLSDYCGKRGWDLAELMAPPHPILPVLTIEDLPVVALRTLSRLAHHQLKFEQKVRGTDEEHTAASKELIRTFVSCLNEIAIALGSPLSAAVQLTWEEVRKRDWKKYPKKGVPDEDQAVRQQ